MFLKFTCEKRRFFLSQLHIHLPKSQEPILEISPPLAPSFLLTHNQPALCFQDLPLLMQTRMTMRSRKRTNILGLWSCAVACGRYWLISIRVLSLGYSSKSYKHIIIKFQWRAVSQCSQKEPKHKLQPAAHKPSILKFSSIAKPCALLGKTSLFATF